MIDFTPSSLHLDASDLALCNGGCACWAVSLQDAPMRLVHVAAALGRCCGQLHPIYDRAMEFILSYCLSAIAALRGSLDQLTERYFGRLGRVTNAVGRLLRSADAPG